MRVAFYCNLMGWPKRSSGGVRQWVLTMVHALIERGIAVDVLCEAPISKFVDEPLLDSRVGRVLLGGPLMARWRLNRYVRTHPGVRIVAALNHYNLGAALLKRRFGDRVHVLLTQHENLSADAAWMSRRKYARVEKGVRQHYSEADAVVAVSRGLADDLRTNFCVQPARLHTIYNPAFRADFLACADHPIDHPWLTHKECPVVIAAGRLHHVKAFDDLLHAFKRLRESNHARLLILGEGKERAKLEALVKTLQLQDCVQLPGRVGSLAPWMARTDLYVLPSRREGLPTVLIEALSIGMPIVATRCPSGPDEILQEGRWGALVPVGDVPALAEAMAQALRSPPPDRAALRARAAEFSLERALEQYLRLWQQPPR